MVKRNTPDLRSGEELVQLLAFMCPGRDAQVKINTNDHRYLSGYWLWSITQMQHQHVSRREVRSRYPGDKLQVYHGGIFRRIWRWVDAIKLLRKYEEGSKK